MPAIKKNRSQTNQDLLLFGLAAICVTVLYRMAGDFYAVQGDAQLDHPLYDRWRSSGSVGRLIGTAAVIMFALNLFYLARRRLRSWHKWGKLRHWMSSHVFFGLLGGGLLLLHADFHMTSEAARISAQAVVALLATGLIGRYLYALVPHTASGEEDPAGLRGRGEAAIGRLQALLPPDHPLVDKVRHAARLHAPTGGVRGLRMLTVGWLLPLVRRLQLRHWLGLHHGTIPHENREDIRREATTVLGLGYDLAVAGTAAWILRRWRLVHLAAAVVMVWAAWRHVASAIRTGYDWPLPGGIVAWSGGLGAFLAALGAREFLWRRRFRRRIVMKKVAAGAPPEPPPTLHPYINPAICIGSAACVAACPEGDILGLLEGRARLDHPGHCIGHGACAANCPVEAITLVFGSLKRGVDIPDVSPHYESSVSGIYMAGELTGMGLIRNAVEQATQAVNYIAAARARDNKPAPDDGLDLLIVGAGPAGVAASLAAQEKGLTYLTVEQEPDMGGAVRHYPRRKLVMTAPMKLPLHGPVQFHHVAKEELMELFQTLRDNHQPAIEFGIKIDALEPLGSEPGFVVSGGGRRWVARRVLLCLGRRGTPMKLGVPGEESPHIIYNLLDPIVYRARAVAVVGGGDSALEAAFSLAKAGASAVHLIHRREAFDRARQANRERLQGLVETGAVTVHYNAAVAQVAEDHLTLQSGLRLDVTDVVVSIGGTLPVALLKAAGVKTRTHFGRPVAASA